MRFFQFSSALIASFLLVFASLANADAQQDLNAARQQIQVKITAINPKFKIETIEPTELKGFYTVKLVDGPKLYMEQTGSYFFDGTFFTIKDDQLVNITEQEDAKERLKLVKEFNEKEMIVFAPTPPVKTRATINVFTDVDCFYCQKLHKEVPEMNARGIKVRYLAFPRAGVGSDSYKKIVSAWCAEDQQTSLTLLKNRQAIPEKTCDNPVDKQYELGHRMGVSGTPAIVLEDGSMIPGYRSADKLAESLGI